MLYCTKKEGINLVTIELLEKLDTPREYIDQILVQDGIYGETIEKSAKEYILTGEAVALVPYDSEEARTKAHERAIQYLDRAKALSTDEKTQYMLMYLFWIHCIPYAKRFYKMLSIDDEIFYTTMKDLTYKLKECVAVHDAVGVFADWFFLQFDMKLFGTGRLQFEVYRFMCDSYCAAGVELKKGDPVYSCHIPSSGPLTVEACMDSLDQAYALFKKELTGTVLPVVVCSWLIYPPYLGSVFPEGSNIYRFSQLFDIIVQRDTPTFSDDWRVFNRHYTGSTQDLPTDTGMRRRMVDYINGGGIFGWGYGVLLYDGEKKKILNR